jgi:hypothetical protein
MNIKSALNTWAELNAALKDCTEKEALKLMETERAGGNRARVLIRLHSRMNKLRADRERKEIMGSK